LEDLKAATQMATRLTRLRGEEHLSPEVVAALTEERQRAFTQVIKAYDEARAAIAFLRRTEGDAEVITPNLYVANTRRRKALEPATGKPTDPLSPSPVTPVPAGSIGAGTGNGAPPASPTVPKTSSPYT
jgi:hypothetical protein